MYFENFTFTKYDFTVPSDTSPIIENIIDLTKRVQLKITEHDIDQLCDKYIILEGETPERISYKLYGTPFYHWTILYVNGIFNFYSNWPITEQALVQFCNQKYGAANIYNTHHYEKIPELLIMDETFIQEQINLGNFQEDSIKEVSNFEYEDRQNELKKFIKVISPERIAGFVDMYNKAMLNNE